MRGATSTRRSRAASQAKPNRSRDSASLSSASGSRDAEIVRHRAARGVSQDRVGPRPHREAAFGQAGEHDRGKAQPAKLERREHRDAVATDSACLHRLAGQQIAQRLGRGAQVDDLPEHLEGQQAPRDIHAGGGRLGREHLGDDLRHGGRPSRPRGTLGQCPGRGGEALHGRFEGARRAQPSARVLQATGLAVIVAARLVLAGLEPLDGEREAPAKPRDALGPLLAAGHDARFTRLVEPHRLLPRRVHTVAKRRDGQKVDDRPARKRLAHARRHDVQETRHQARATRAIRQATGDPQSGRDEVPGHGLHVRAAWDDDGTVDQGGAAFGGGEDGACRLASLGPLVRNGDHLQRAVTGQRQRAGAGPHPGQPLPVRSRSRSGLRREMETAIACDRDGGGVTGRHAVRQRYEGVGAGCEQAADQRLLGHVEVVDAVQDHLRRAVVRSIRGAFEQAGRVASGERCEPVAVGRVQEPEVRGPLHSVAATRGRRAGGRRPGPRGRHTRLSQVGERGCDGAGEVRASGDRPEIGELLQPMLDEAAHETLANDAAEHHGRSAIRASHTIACKGREGDDIDVGHRP